MPLEIQTDAVITRSCVRSINVALSSQISGSAMREDVLILMLTI
jgi:hypothetical protein